jgi:alpha,alpha-trehalose phosphorylase
MASKLGFTKKAYSYFGDSAKLDLFNTHKNTKDGIHTANMGGNYMAIVYGFAGLRIKENGIYFAPIIPDQWKKYRFKINYEDSQIEVDVNKEESKFTLIKGSPKEIFIRDRKYNLKDTITV